MAQYNEMKSLLTGIIIFLTFLALCALAAAIISAV